MAKFVSMTIKNIYVRYIQLPFQSSFLDPTSNPQYSDSIILEVQTSTGILAYGEAFPHSFNISQTLHDVKKEVEKHLPLLKKQSFHSLYDIKEFIQEDLASKMKAISLCALEMALLHAWAIEQNKSLPEIFKVEIPDSLPYIGVLPKGNLALLSSDLETYSFKQIKLKINRDLSLTLENIQTLRSIFGEEVHIQVDIEGSWLAEDALEQIPDLLDQGIRVFEQPFDNTQDLRMTKLQRRYKGDLEFVADESIVRYKDAVRLIKREACTRFNLKIAKQGGIFNTLDIYRLATQYGIQCELGTLAGESSLLKHMGILFAGQASELVNIEHGLADLALAEDISKINIQADSAGNLSIPHDIFSPNSTIDAGDLEKYQVKMPSEALD